jgi:hypothetical protein
VQEVKGYLVLRELKNSGDGYFVITDSANGNRIHDVKCSFVTEENFATKVLKNRSKNGHYYWIDSVAEGISRFQAQPCKHCCKEL